MKNQIQLLLLSVFLSGCASLSDLTQLIRTPTSVPPADTSTPIPSVTPAPTQNLFATSTPTPLTFTPTVTQIGAELFTPTGTETEFPTVYPTFVLPPEVFSGTYFTPNAEGFLTILLSSGTLYWNAGPCMPREVKVTAFVEDTVNTDKVLLFTRLREKSNTLEMTDWNAGAIMIKNEENGSYNYTLHTWNLDQYYYFRDAYLEYQLVSVDKDLNVLARTPVYDRNLSLVMCRMLQ